MRLPLTKEPEPNARHSKPRGKPIKNESSQPSLPSKSSATRLRLSPEHPCFWLATIGTIAENGGVNVGRKRQQTTAITKKDRAELVKFFRRAEQGDEEALAVTREWFDDTPSACDKVGDWARTAEDSLVKLTAKNPVIQEALHSKLNALRREIGGPDPSPLEDLLARRVAACWLHVHYLETIYALNVENNGLSGRWSESMQRSIDRAQKRYLSSIKTLVQVRRLLGPVLQLNLAEKQVNIAQLTHGK